MIRSRDIVDGEIFDSSELSSDGYLPIVNNINITSVISGEITISGFSLLYEEVKPKIADRVYIKTSNIDGYFTIKQILSEFVFKVFEVIPDSSFGFCDFIYKPGAYNIGFDGYSSGIPHSNVQDALKWLQANSSGISQSYHENLNTLAHDYVSDGYGVITYNSACVSLPVNYTIYENNLLLKKIQEYDLTYDIYRKVTQIDCLTYDNIGVVNSLLRINIYYLNQNVSSIKYDRII